MTEAVLRRLRRVVATGIPGVALQDTADGSICTPQRAVFLDSFQGVLAASRRETTIGADQRADRDLIEADDADENAADGSAEDTHEVILRQRLRTDLSR